MTKPSRFLSNGREARLGSSLRPDTAFSEQKLEDFNVEDLSDLDAQVPNLTVYAARGSSSTITAYIREHVVHAEIVLLAAMIAVSRKAITFDFKQVDPIVAFGIAGLLLALAAAYFLLKRVGVCEEKDK
mgnify:CR=1 FL=1